VPNGDPVGAPGAGGARLHRQPVGRAVPTGSRASTDLYAVRRFFENLLILNWSAEQLGKIILLGQSFNAIVKMLELSMSMQEKFGVTEQREKVRRIHAIQNYVREIELCPDFDGLFDNP
jgi:hypothetical protein